MAKLKIDVFTKKHLNLFGIPKGSFVKEFITNDFDILLDLNTSKYYPLIFLAGASRARFKVGMYEKELVKIFDFMIYKKEDIYIGPYAESAPDIVFFLKDGECLADVRLFDELWQETSWVTGRGTHRRDGLFIAYGNGIRKDISVKASITDLVPIVLYLLEIPIPHELDGVLPISIFEEDFLQLRAPHYETLTTAKEETVDEVFSFTDEEEKKIFQKLKGLGYMG